MSSSDNNSRKKSRTAKRSFKCNSCRQSFLNEDDYWDHKKEENARYGACLWCGRNFDNYCTYCYILCGPKSTPPQPPPPPPRTTVSVNEEAEESSCVILHNIANEVGANNEANSSLSARKNNIKHTKIVQPLNGEQNTLKTETKLIMILHECDSNIREKKPLKSKQICSICDKICDRETGQDIRGHARVHGTVFLKYSQERLYRAIRCKQMEIPIIKIEEEEDTTIIEIKD